MTPRWLPTLPELFFIAVLLWLFAAGDGWSVLLADGDTGWHIRNGERILACACFPRADPFAIGTAGHLWFSWEWLTDVLYALLHRMAGLKAVVFFSGAVIAATFAVVLRHCLWRGANPLVALPVVLLATGASSLHFLARPHVLTLLLLAVCAWALDRDRREPTPWVWGLPLLVALWCNLHGGFLALFPMLAAVFLEACFEARGRARRYAWLTALCALATCVNPYGWRLHLHVLAYLQSDWIRNSIQEFQSPQFRSEGLLQFEMLLALGLVLWPGLARRRRWAGCGLLLFWGHQALGSARHVPIYCVTAAPYISSELEACWARWSNRTGRAALGQVLRRAGAEWRAWTTGFSSAPALLCGVLLMFPWGQRWPADFPANKFPSAIVNRNWGLLGGAPGQPAAVFSSDQWSDYLIYRRYPALRVFFDGRSDFFAVWRGPAYSRLLQGSPGCVELLKPAGVRLALVPVEWPLAGLLATRSDWKPVDRDFQAILFERVDAPRDTPKLAAPNSR
ncbi:MAG TPA: hypothetical protein DEQ47_10480 [Solibacterales bacterium]|nr:hypothetical protein [Bryobacterales bacterium]